MGAHDTKGHFGAKWEHFCPTEKLKCVLLEKREKGRNWEIGRALFKVKISLNPLKPLCERSK